MNGYKTIESKLWNEISMLTSGVLTSLIYGLLSGSSYKLDIEGKHYVITSTGMSAWCAFGLVTITFFILWALISLLIPWFLRIRKRFVYDKIKKVSAKGLIKVIDEAKVSIKDLYIIFGSEDNALKNKDMLRICSRDLAKTISLLHRNFLPQNKRLRKTIEKYFRHHDYSSIITIDQKVSGYELSAAVELLRYMVGRLKLVAGNDALLERDCAEMEKALADLDQLNNL